MNKKLMIAALFLLALTPLMIAADTPLKVHMVPVHIDSRPDLAEVWIDGKFVGSTTLSYRLTPGEHKVELVRPRYATWTRTLTVEPEQPTRVAALLQESGEKPCQ
jgi:PEGA domain